MIKVKVVCVGKVKEKYFSMAIDEYAKRLSRFCSFEIVEVVESSLPDKPSNAEIAQVVLEEGKKLLAKCSGYVIACDLHHDQWSSEELSKKLQQIKLTNSTVTFLIGGSYGLSQEVKQKANAFFCFGNITLPHTLARVVLCEQIYRAFMLENNSCYHK